ncbi:MAG: hypothetical protein F6K63_24630 [Moorea sp. SIO1G6]|uniref:hypothetical protein n=1 Tax=Moorena sp. SIO4E2 TaxID=2607826 RepID=UPI0013C1739F|nr:hypothetical protein [Moorena sp. SIO4E2]NET67394.1 hypothetical protein [Moorena sp. SIO1G6]
MDSVDDSNPFLANCCPDCYSGKEKRVLGRWGFVCPLISCLVVSVIGNRGILGSRESGVGSRE